MSLIQHLACGVLFTRVESGLICLFNALNIRVLFVFVSVVTTFCVWLSLCDYRGRGWVERRVPDGSKASPLVIGCRRLVAPVPIVGRALEVCSRKIETLLPGNNNERARPSTWSIGAGETHHTPLDIR